MDTPSDEDMRKAYEAVQRKRQQNAAYMKKFRQEHREEWNRQQRERNARKRAAKLAAAIESPLKTTTPIISSDTHAEEEGTGKA